MPPSDQTEVTDRHYTMRAAALSLCQLLRSILLWLGALATLHNSMPAAGAASFAESAAASSGQSGSAIHGQSQLREENAKLKILVAELTRDKHILGEIVRKKTEAGATARARGMERSPYGASLCRACRLAKISRSLCS